MMTHGVSYLKWGMGVSVVNWGDADVSIQRAFLVWERRALDQEADELSTRLDDTDFDHSWENVSRLIVPLAIKMKAVRLRMGSAFTGPLISNCDGHIQAYTKFNQPYIRFWYFGELKKRVKVTI